MNKPYSNWIKISNALSNHTSFCYHCDCVKDADTLKMTVEIPTLQIDVMSNTALQKHLNENKQIMRQIVCAILYLARQGLASLKVFAENDKILYEHLNTPRAKNAMYLSPRSQMK